MALSCENFIMGLSNPDFYNLGQELNCACPQQSLSTDILHLLAFVEIRLFNVFFLEKKNEIRYSDGKSAGCGILVKKERECGIRTSLPDPHSMYPTKQGPTQ